MQKVKLISRGEPKKAVAGFGVRAPNPPIETTIECPVHGIQVYDDFVRLEPYCPVCAQEKLERERITKAVLRKCSITRGATQEVLASLKADEGRDLSTFSNFVLDPNEPKQKFAYDVCQRFATRFVKRLEEQERLMAEGKDWRNANSKGLCLVGKTCTGKTHLSFAIANELEALGVDVFYTTIPRLLEEAYSQRTNTAAVVRAMGQVSCLILDEVGMQRGSEAESRILHQLVDTRYRAGKPTVIVGNLPMTKLEDVMDVRVVRRLRETTFSIAFTWAPFKEPLSNQKCYQSDTAILSAF